MINIWIVFHKESLDNLRDRRSFFMALLYPFIGALLLGLLLGFVGGMFKRQAAVPNQVQARQLTLPIYGAERAPGLIAYLHQHGVEVVAAPANPRRAVKRGETDVVLVVTKNYSKRFEKMRPAEVHLATSSSISSSRPNSFLRRR